MRLLKAVPDSVLWLLEAHPLAAENLRKEAEARGVDSDRLLFARRVPAPEHLARHDPLVSDAQPVSYLFFVRS